MTLPQPEIYRDYEIVPVFHYANHKGYNGKSDWLVFKKHAEQGYMRSKMTLSEVKESIDDLLNQ